MRSSQALAHLWASSAHLMHSRTQKTPFNRTCVLLGKCRVSHSPYGEAMNFEELLELVRILRDNLTDHVYKTNWHSATRMDDGVIAMGYPQYEPWIWNGIFASHSLLCDFMGGEWEHYLELDLNNHESIAQANLNELTDWILHLWRGERFCDGHIGQATELGCTLIAQRTIELAEEWLALHPHPTKIRDTLTPGWYQE